MDDEHWIYISRLSNIDWRWDLEKFLLEICHVSDKKAVVALWRIPRGPVIIDWASPLPHPGRGRASEHGPRFIVCRRDWTSESVAVAR